ncbi:MULTISPECIES: flagellar hook-length control protein FliK [Mesorhizobium]|uniref:Chemotaxis protein MotD n=2 Tax=Mesorhizobium TaxID=68287 RepID=A0A1A5JK95_RHILI|nr:MULTISPECIES: flagellar hook-length control protein FliK [Mesorhizobium]MBE1706568.1 flagellar hook-length control protein FliK [Mesorhizobium japonicum]MBE1714921.1 flagellar hook-length control protein FliK [Mesorhizobium japonicum]MUT23082.1 flagellar hook-length control protein FliK [Mesorhizobium japonicum]MUT26878.1 flagellar hook-length control protein FliK [Mesorhizobium japonicum]OBP80520.1 chemotaxis protein MotD [Mesorhizobium loti]
MTPSLGPALPGFTAARTAEQPAAPGKKDDAGFGKMVHGGAGQAEKQPTTERGARDPGWSKLAAGLAAQAGEDEPMPAGKARTAPTGAAAAKSMKDGKDIEADKDADTEAPATDAGATPLDDHLPLLMAFHDLRHFSTSAKSADAGETGQGPALDGQLLSKAYRPTSAGHDDLEPMPKPERVSLVDGPLTKLESARDASAGTGAPRRDNAIAAGPLPETTTAEVPGVEPKQATPQLKSIADVQSSLRSEPGKPLSAQARVDVVSERSFPAPPQAPMSQAALNVINAVAADVGPQQAFSTASATTHMAGSVAVPTHVLKIELHPAELGMVTAHLRLSGEQLSIELKPETHDAYRRLSSDSEAIVKSLRGLGFEVDKVTIMQPSVAVPATTRTDATASLTAAPGRDQSAFQPGNSNGGNSGAGGQQPGQQSARGNHDDAQAHGRAASPSRERAGGDMFI